MKRIICFILCLVVMLSFLTGFTVPQAKFKIMIDNKEVVLKLPPIVSNSQIYLPLKETFNLLGYNIEADIKNEQFLLKDKDNKVISNVSLSTPNMFLSKDINIPIGKVYSSLLPFEEISYLGTIKIADNVTIIKLDKSTPDKLHKEPIVLCLYSWVPQTDEKGYLDYKMKLTRIEKNIIGTPELKLVATNLTDKKIVAFEFECQFYDSFDRPVNKLGTNAPIFKGIVQDTNLFGKLTKFEDTNLYYKFINDYIDKNQYYILNNTQSYNEIRQEAEKLAKAYASSVQSNEYTFNLTLYELANRINIYEIKPILVKFEDDTVWKYKK